MWQIMWAFSLIPDSVMHWLINILLIVGVVGVVAGFFVKFIPFVNRYRLPVQILSIVLLTLGVWLKGGESERLVWQERVKELESRVAKAERQAEEASKKINVRVVERVKIIRENANNLAQEASSAISADANARCEIPKVSADRYNEAAKGESKK